MAAVLESIVGNHAEPVHGERRDPVLCAYCQAKITLIDMTHAGVSKLTCPRCGRETHVLVTANRVMYTVKAQS